MGRTGRIWLTGTGLTCDNLGSGAPSRENSWHAVGHGSRWHRDASSHRALGTRADPGRGQLGMAAREAGLPDLSGVARGQELAGGCHLHRHRAVTGPGRGPARPLPAGAEPSGLPCRIPRGTRRARPARAGSRLAAAVPRPPPVRRGRRPLRRLPGEPGRLRSRAGRAGRLVNAGIAGRYPRPASGTSSRRSREDLPTSAVKGPGGQAQPPAAGSQTAKARAGTVSTTSARSPGAALTAAKAPSARAGRPAPATGLATYAWTISRPGRDPVLLTRTRTWTSSPGAGPGPSSDADS